MVCATIAGEDGGMLNGGVHSNPLAQPYPTLAPSARPQFFPQYAMPTQQQVSTSPGRCNVCILAVWCTRPTAVVCYLDWSTAS